MSLAVSLANLAAVLAERHPWRELARCGWSDVRLDWFFPDKGAPEGANKVRRARQVCAPCPVKAECLAYALAHRCDGVWAGTTWGQRRKLIRSYVSLLEQVEAGLQVALVASLTGRAPALNHPNEWIEEAS